MAQAWLGAAGEAAEADAAEATEHAAASARRELIVQELAWLAAAAAAADTQEQGVSACEGARVALVQAGGPQNAKTAVTRAIFKTRTKEDLEEEVAPEEKARARAPEEAAAALDRRFEGCLDHLRRLSKRGLPEAPAVLAIKYAALYAPTPQVSKAEPPLEFHFHSLVK